MKHGYLINLLFKDSYITMPYIFKTMKEACYYGEYKYRTEEDMINYSVTECNTMTDFYKLKSR